MLNKYLKHSIKSDYKFWSPLAVNKKLKSVDIISVCVCVLHIFYKDLGLLPLLSIASW
mgnify:CR=1 FL=1